MAGGPERETTTLTRKERATWMRTVVAEVRRDEIGYAAQAALVRTLDDVAAIGGWCDHDRCGEARQRALDSVMRPLWVNPR